MRNFPLLLGVVLVTACAPSDKAEDGYGEVSGTASGLSDDDGDGFFGEEDCADSDAAVHPGAVEICNGLDDNCDGQIDEGVLQVWYADTDADGFGDPEQTLEACSPPSGHTASGTDCDDGNPDIYPGAVEICDELDNNCDGTTDEGIGDTWAVDADGDGFGDPTRTVEACEAPEGTVSLDRATDCDDGRGDVFPGATEVCNELDDDCDTEVDEGVLSTFYIDLDGDGWGDLSATTEACTEPVGYATDPGDCNDGNANISPDATEVCNGVDDDCDDATDDEDPSVDLTTGSTFYTDTDTDGFGDPATATVACIAPAGTVPDASDCDDGNQHVNPLATEVCNGIDDDCDSAIDDDDPSLDPSTRSTWYPDGDGDGYGRTDDATTACAAPSGHVADGGDCDDGSTAYHPGAAPGCDGEDYDCDGQVDNDADGDDFADEACGGDDCDDDDASIYPDPFTGVCALGLTCADILDSGRGTADGTYTIDPDGPGTGVDPFAVFCDMTTDGGGWTEIAYADDLTFQQHFTGGDFYRFLPDDFTFELDDLEIAAIQAVSTEGFQEYVGQCEHVIHYYYDDGGSYNYAFGFEFFDGTQTVTASSSYAPHNITVTQDACSGNGGEGGSLSQTTIFELDSPLVPVLNVQCRDCGDTTPEQFGSLLTDNPAWLR